MKTLRTVVFMLIFYIVGGLVFFHEAEDFSWIGEWTRDTSVLSGLGPRAERTGGAEWPPLLRAPSASPHVPSLPLTSHPLYLRLPPRQTSRFIPFGPLLPFV